MIKKHGINLVPLDIGHLTMLREWRNGEFVRSKMLNQKPISQQQHQDWFRGLDHSRQYHFIIEDGIGNYGSCNLILKVDEQNKLYAESGIFAANEHKASSLTPVKAICILYDWAFNSLAVSYISAHIRENNKRAIRFNKKLGFDMKHVDEGVVHAVLDHAAFEKKYTKMKPTLGD